MKEVCIMCGNNHVIDYESYIDIKEKKLYITRLCLGCGYRYEEIVDLEKERKKRQ